MTKYSQHVSNYNAFFSVKKTYKDESETTVGSHLYSKDNLGNVTTRYSLNKKDGKQEWKEITGTFLDSITGIISSIKIKDAKKLDDGRIIPEQIDIHMPTDDGKIDVVSMFVDSKAGDNFMRRIGSVDFSQEVTIKPYAYIKEGKLIEGLSIEQDGNRIDDNYTEFKLVDGKNVPVNKNGLEQFDSKVTEAKTIKNDKLRTDAWKSYFTHVSVFLMEEMKKLPVFDAVSTTTTVKEDSNVAPADVSDAEFDGY